MGRRFELCSTTDGLHRNFLEDILSKMEVPRHAGEVGRQRKALGEQGGGNRYEADAGLKEFALPEKNPDAPGQLYNLEPDPVAFSLDSCQR